jgi:rfaE bifunctional protein kinase chain/domain
MKMKEQDLINYFDSFKDKTVLVVGDIGLDLYIHGSVERLSQDAPIPVFVENFRFDRAAMAGNVAANICSLGGRAILCGVVGDDPDGISVMSNLDCAHVSDTERTIIKQGSTTVKTRYVHDGGRSVFRVDADYQSKLTDEQYRRCLESIDTLLDQCDILLLQDYAKGFLVDHFIQSLIRMADRKGKWVIVDPSSKKDPHNYSGADLIKMNSSEALSLYRKIGEHEATAIDYDLMHKELDIPIMIMTEGKYGSYLSNQSGRRKRFNNYRHDVSDPCGAGDSFVAALALMCDGERTNWDEAIEFSGYVAAAAVVHQGTVSVKPEDVLAIVSYQEKVKSLAREKLDRFRKSCS